jgi:hypothetical protein
VSVRQNEDMREISAWVASAAACLTLYFLFRRSGWL